jgi:diguanylate cyclase (GGDEF)-like protein
MADVSPDVLARLTPAKLIFHWKTATAYTVLLGVTVVWLFLSLHRYPATFAPDHLQAIIRAACILPLLSFCFLSIAFQRLATYGLMPGAVLLGTALALWMDTAAASLSYGLINGLGPEWLKTALMILTTFGILVAALSGALFSYRAQRKEQATSGRDALTGLLNRTGLLHWYDQLPTSQPCTLVVFDLNQLKTINDTSGHGAGDTYIRSIGQAIRTALTGIGRVGRWGGDEFAAIVPAVSEAQVAKTIEALLRITPRSDGNLPAFAYGTASLNAGEPLERPFAVADGRMYERKERQRNNKTQHVREINAVEEVSKELELLRTSEELLTSGLPLVASLLRFDGMFYMQRRADTWVITNLQVPHGLQVPITNGYTQTLNEGLAGRAYRTGSALWSTDYPTDPDASPTWIATGLKTTLITPVRCLGEIVGFIYLCNFSTWRSITPQVRRMTDIIALRLGHVFDLERTERDVRRTEQDVRATLEGGLLGLGAALEARDLETGGHTRRVVEYATRLGESLTLPPEYLAALRQGAYLHDIGKLVIPDAILLKPGKLTPEEWEVMKTHSCKGYDIARSIPTLTEGALDVIRSHHERWDGTGYPDALSEDDIPLVARIFSVCDVYDALTSDRPYKKAWPEAEAKAEIARQAGTQFDPEVVQAFLTTVAR